MAALDGLKGFLEVDPARARGPGVCLRKANQTNVGRKTILIIRHGLISRLWAVGLVMAIALGAWAALAISAQALPLNAGADLPELTVYRSPTCRCCSRWIDHMKAAGFAVRDIVTDDMVEIKAEYGVSEALASCHTAIADGYLIEGHVPASDVQHLLSQHSDVLGIAAPGMPMGSPGMEMGDRVDSYTVVSFTESGETAPFAQHP